MCSTYFLPKMLYLFFNDEYMYSVHNCITTNVCILALIRDILDRIDLSVARCVERPASIKLE